MSLPEGYLPREGDVLIVHLRVKFDVDPGDKDAHMEPVDKKHRYKSIVLPLDQITGLHARSWERDDAVRNVNDHEDFGIVVAVHDDKVWVKTSKGALVTFDANDLEPGGIVDILEPPPMAPPERFNPLAKVGANEDELAKIDADDVVLDAELAQSRAEEVARAGADGGDDDVKF